MNDESIHKGNDDEPRTRLSRRWFIQSAVAVGAATVALGQTKLEVRNEKPVINDGFGVANCECVNEAAIPVMAVAVLGGKYYALTGTEAGPQIFSLNVGRERNASLGKALESGLPENLTYGSLGVARGGLIVTGGVPFVIETLEVDYELSEDVRLAMDNNIPDGIPTSGKKIVEIMGVQPAIFMVNRPNTERLLLPDMPKRSFAVATAVAETSSGGMALLIEHSDGVNESFYASAIDVLEENGRDWNIWSAGRELGESGPNYLAADRDGLAVGINLAQQSRIVTSKTRISTADRILALVPSIEGAMALVKDAQNRTIWSPLSSDGSLTAGPRAEIEGDEIVGAIPVAGAKGQLLLLGRRSTTLIDNIPAVVSRTEGGDRNVM